MNHRVGKPFSRGEVDHLIAAGAGEPDHKLYLGLIGRGFTGSLQHAPPSLCKMNLVVPLFSQLLMGG